MIIDFDDKNIPDQIFVSLVKEFKHEDTKKTQRIQGKTEIIIIFLSS